MDDHKNENNQGNKALDHAEMTKKNARIGLCVLAVVVGMIGLSFASVPLYNLFCNVTGFGGTTQTAQSLPGEDDIIDRVITIKFNSITNNKLPWDFAPEQREIQVKLGQRGLTAFTAYNQTAHETSGSAIYNVTPLKAGQYFHKVQCFCFDRQTLTPHERVSMPVLFYVDPSLNNDPSMEDVNTITLSYSFFPADSKELDTAMEAFYNEEAPVGDN